MQIYDIPINEDKREITQHGAASFPLAIYENQMDLNISGLVNLHWHEEFQICYVVYGCVEFQVNGLSYTRKKGEGIFVNCSRLHMSKAIHPADSKYLCFDIHPRLLQCFEYSAANLQYIQPLIDCAQLDAVLFSGATDWGKCICDKLLEINRAFGDKKPAYQLAIISDLFSIWHALVSANHEKLTYGEHFESVDQQRMKTALTFIHNQYAGKISLIEIADSVHLSQSECCRLFKKNAHCTPFEYLISFRIKQSILLLETTNLPIGSIAMQVGFSSFSYFASRFKKATGVSPKDYRSEHRSAALFAENNT